MVENREIQIKKYNKEMKYKITPNSRTQESWLLTHFLL